MEKDKQKEIETAEFLKTRIKTLPEIGILAGTGLGDCAEAIAKSVSIAYADIPHFPVSTVEGHKGRLILGDMAGMPVIAMLGRFHLYEGYSPLEVTFPIRVMQQLGVRFLILLNATGGINFEFNTGDIMIISDHINLTGENPLVGKNDETLGIRFPDMSQAYDKNLASIAKTAGKETNMNLQTGVYAGLKGPSLETPAEIVFLKTIGADAVGFSTVLEVIAAVHAGMKILGLSLITNIHPGHTSVPEVISVANAAAPKLTELVKKVVEKIT